MYPEGMLFIAGSDVYWRRIGEVLDQVYPHELYVSHFADGCVMYAVPVPFPLGSVYTELAVLSDLGVSGTWYPWDEMRGWSYRPEDGQWAF